MKNACADIMGLKHKENSVGGKIEIHSADVNAYATILISPQIAIDGYFRVFILA